MDAECTEARELQSPGFTRHCNHVAKLRTPYRTILFRGLRLRCPRCGRGPLFRGWFRMYPECEVCGLNFEREPGFYLGSIYVNYGITAFVSMSLYFAGLARDVSPNLLLGGIMAFCLIFPVLMFRHARAIWLAFDQFWDPQENAERDDG